MVKHSMLTSTREFKKLNGDEMTPYATITRFEADQTYQTSNKDSETVLNEVKEHMLSDYSLQ